MKPAPAGIYAQSGIYAGLGIFPFFGQKTGRKMPEFCPTFFTGRRPAPVVFEKCPTYARLSIFSLKWPIFCPIYARLLFHFYKVTDFFAQLSFFSKKFQIFCPVYARLLFFR